MTGNALRRLAIVLMTLATVVFFVGSAIAAGRHHHNSGHALVADKLATNGVHQIDRKGRHAVTAEIRNHKIASFHVKHDAKGDLAVKKYKSRKKMALLEGADPRSVPVQTDLGTVYIAYAYIDEDGNEEFYWFPYEEILDGDTGAVEYVPVT